MKLEKFTDYTLVLKEKVLESEYFKSLFEDFYYDLL